MGENGVRVGGEEYRGEGGDKGNGGRMKWVGTEGCIIFTFSCLPPWRYNRSVSTEKGRRAREPLWRAGDKSPIKRRDQGRC